MPISQRVKKFITSLQLKKYRKQEQCFVVQGAKSVQELLSSDFEVIMLLGTESFLASVHSSKKPEILAVTEKDLAGLSEFQSNDTALAVARIKSNDPVAIADHQFALVLDDIRDPGNLGTIIRTGDWFGITQIVASAETADFYNPKVISATMGSFVRVSIFYTDLEQYLAGNRQPVYGAYLEGEDVHTTQFGKSGHILIGNESRGISPELEKFVTHKITIPRYGNAESLNAAIATAVICDNIRRHRALGIGH
jgi:TrmH family RNA methyltransferase